MKTKARWIAAAATIATLSGLATASAVADPRGYEHGYGMGWGPAEMFAQFDRDGDGRITRSEAEQFRNDRLSRFDGNGDGRLSLDEYRALWTDAMNVAMVRAFQRHDRNGDGVVTAEEFAVPVTHMFDRLDRNGDGAIARDELRWRGRHDGRGRDWDDD